jgi:hypothetical protein
VKCESAAAAVAIGPHKVEPRGLIVIVRKRTKTNGCYLRGDDNYKLHVPPNVPAKQFWALTLYDRETCDFIREMPRAGVDSYNQKMQRNADGSVVERKRN